MKASKTFYRVSKILSIVFIVFLVIGVAIGAGSIAYILATQSFPYVSQGVTYTREQVQGMLIYIIVLGVIGVSFLIANLVISIKAPKQNTKALHITAIVFGVLSGVIFDIPAAILALKENSKKPVEEQK